jgi:hypothetical protein
MHCSREQGEHESESSHIRECKEGMRGERKSMRTEIMIYMHGLTSVPLSTPQDGAKLSSY